MPVRTEILAASLQYSLVAAGLFLLWRVALSPAARAQRPPPALEEWRLPATEFLRFLFLIVCGTLLAGLAGQLLLKLRPLAGPPKIIFLTGCSHVGMIGGVALFKFFVERVPRSAAGLRREDFTAGAVAFLVALPVLVAVSLPWRALLKLGGLQVEKQDLVDMFVNARSPALLAVMIGLATVTAPLAEELIFRAGLFRFLRTRVPRWAALLGPACVFGALHQNLASFAPLVALGIVFSLAYERTGRIGTTIVAHALFNLYAVVLVFAGVTE